MSLFKKINDAIGLTKSERLVFWFLIFAFIVGLAVKFIRGDVGQYRGKIQFDYSAFDAEFEKRSAEIEKHISEFDKKSSNEFKVNINTATKEELMRLPGIGEQTAEKIIQHREIYGEFKRVEDLMNVKGIGQKKFERIRKYLTTNN